MGGQKNGPFSRDDFVRLIEMGVVADTTLVWCGGMAKWQPLAEVRAQQQLPQPGAPVPGVVPPPPVAPGAPAAAAPTAAPAGPVSFEFTGQAGEYFKIWIVNLLLTIVTFGIYAAWAKVRNRRYFHANTRLLGHAFNYTGNPVRILIGNLIVMGMVIVYFTSGAISVALLVLVILLFMLLSPWLVVKSLSFNARNSTYRGLRFGFDGSYGQAAGAYLGLPILSLFTLHLLFPWVMRRQKQFVFDNHRYGTTAFAFGGQTPDFYKLFGKALLFFAPVLVVYAGLIFSAIATKAAGGTPNPTMMGIWGLLLFPALIVAMLGGVYFRANLFNLIWNNVTLGRHRFVANMNFGGLLGLQIVNALAVVFTLGLMTPWARVRQAAFTLASLQFVPEGSIDDLVGGADEADQSAIGEAAVDYFDFDIGLGT